MFQSLGSFGALSSAAAETWYLFVEKQSAHFQDGICRSPRGVPAARAVGAAWDVVLIFFRQVWGTPKRWIFGFRFSGVLPQKGKTQKTYAQNYRILRILRVRVQRCVYIRSSLRTYVMLPAAVTTHTVHVFASSETSRSSSHYQSQSVARRQPHDQPPKCCMFEGFG